MIAWRRLPAWFLRAWAVLALVPFFAVHAIALHAFPWQAAWVHKIVGLSLQLLGGLLILWSVNDNLGLFHKTSLAGTFMAWVRDFPTTRHHAILAATGMASSSGMAAALSVGRKTPTTLEERISELEVLLQELRADLNAKVNDLATRVEVGKKELSALIHATDGKIASLSERVEKATVGGFKLQALGVLLAIYGAVTSVLAQAYSSLKPSPNGGTLGPATAVVYLASAGPSVPPSVPAQLERQSSENPTPAIHLSMLPNAALAFVEPSKVRDYLLSQSHPVGRFKSVVFMAIGYAQDNWQILRDDLLDLAQSGVASLGQCSPYGQKYEVSGNLIGPNGRAASFRTVWLVRPDDPAPRFVTAFPG